jgi:hypothetical protein
MPDTPEQLLNLVFDENSQLAIEFYQAYGRALSAWARIETNLGYQFHSITNTRIEIALPVFYSARNFNGRTDMLGAALKNSGVSEDFKICLRAAIKKAVSYNGFRNLIAHGQPALHFWPGQRQKDRMVLSQGKADEPEVWSTLITVTHLLNAAHNFSALARLVFDVGDPSERLLPQLRALPALPHSSPEAPE